MTYIGIISSGDYGVDCMGKVKCFHQLKLGCNWDLFSVSYRIVVSGYIICEQY